MAELIEISVAHGCQIAGEPEQWESASGVQVKRMNLVYDDSFDTVCYMYGAGHLFCISCRFPLEAAEE